MLDRNTEQLFLQNSGIGDISQLRQFVRNLSPNAWYRQGLGVTVTGSGVSSWADQAGSSHDLLQGTDANRPIALLYTGTNYLYCPGVASNYASTPDSAANSITGDIDIRIKVNADDYTPIATQYFFSKWTTGGNQRSLAFGILLGGQPVLYQSTDGTAGTVATFQSTAATSLTDKTDKWIRVTLDVDNGSAGRTAKFYLSDDGSAWTQLGLDVTVATAANTFDSTSGIHISGIDNGTTQAFSGRIYRASIYSTIGGTTPVVDFNPALASDQAATFVASTGETWTINTSGSLPAQIVASSRIMGNGTSHKMACSTYTANQPRTIAALMYGISWTAGDFLFSGVGAEAGVTQVTGTPQIGLNAGSAAAANANFTLGAWHVVLAVINGANSVLRVDNTADTTGNAGANNPAGIALFANQLGSGYFNGMVKELIDFPTALDATQRARVIQYLARLGGLGF